MRSFPALCLSLIIATGSCANSSSPDSPASSGGGTSTTRRQTEGVAGRITNEEGRAVEGASVLAAPLDAGGPAVPEMTIVSDAEGRYQWPLRPGRYEITVILDGYQRVSKQVTVSASGSAALDFVLSRDRRAGARSPAQPS